VDQARGSGQPLGGRFRLGIIPTVAPFVLPAALPVLRVRFPQLRLYLREDLTRRLLADLKAGVLDAAVVALPYDMDGLEWANVVEDELLAAFPANHPLTVEARIAPERLDGEELILLEDGHCLREHALAACGPGLPGRDQSFAATSLPTLVQMVGSGLGVSFLPAMAVDAGLALAAAVTVRPLDCAQATRQIVVAWRAGSSRAREGRLLAELLALAMDLARISQT
jgi:LysR family hydrogen peroxide-inducible transcriptional activator